MSDTRPSREELLVRTAELWAERSTCTKANGAVIAREGRIIAIGYNGAPAGFPHCLDVGCDPGPDGGCLRTIHAEANSIAMAAKFGIPTDGASMYCTSSPCPTCAKLIINAGIAAVYYRHQYRLAQGVALMAESGITCEMIERPDMSLEETLSKAENICLGAVSHVGLANYREREAEARKRVREAFKVVKSTLGIRDNT